jgi:hypothetical protein
MKKNLYKEIDIAKYEALGQRELRYRDYLAPRQVEALMVGELDLKINAYVRVNILNTVVERMYCPLR